MRQFLVRDRYGYAVLSDESAPPTPPTGVALFAWVKQELLESIARGEFSRDEPFITQREIVERFGVSTTTAIRALNELVTDGIVVRRRGRGTFVAERPSAARRVPDAARPGDRVITFVSPGSGGAHGAELLTGLAAECAEHGSRLVVEHTDSAADETPVLSRLAEGGTHGVVLFTHDRSTAAGALAQLEERGVAVVLVDRYLPGHPTDAVLFDDLSVGYEVTAAMLERGHTAPLMLWSEADATSVRDRLAGHRRALRDHGSAELPERFVLRPYDHQEEQTRRRRLQELLAAAPQATSIICGNAPTLALAVSDLLAMETSFPGSLELAAMDQFLPHEASPLAISPLAVVSARLPTRQMGQQAARLLHERLDGADGPLRHVVLPAPVQVADRGQNTLGVIGVQVGETAGSR
jgi:GntR family transcriptional regulator of arabinose operon